MLEEKLKIKLLTKEQIIISLDRLTRFKPTEEKYLRVFKDVITSNLIYPKFKKNELDLMDYERLTKLAQEIFNFSIKSLKVELKNNLKINKKLLEYEKSVFKFDKNVEKLLKNKIYYETALNFFDGGIAIPPYGKNLPYNLKWLKSLAQDSEQTKNRADFSLKLPIEKVVITEGITEEILLPKFAKVYGYDFDKEGVFIISAGGKNPVVKLFYKYADILKLPIFVLLDSDAKENLEEIKPKLRKFDKVYILKNGEFEDTLPLNLIKKTLNKMLKNFSSVSIEDIRQNKQMTKVLTELLKSNGLEFKKAEFAQLVSENIKDKNDLSKEIIEVIKEIKK